MTPEQFTYWLQGYSEVCGKKPSKDQWQVIEDHLKLVFEKQTPLRDGFSSTPPIIEWRPRKKTDTTAVC